MKKKTSVFILAVIMMLIGVGATTTVSSAPAITIGDGCDPGYVYSSTVYTNSEIVSKMVICPVLGVLTTFNSPDGVNVSEQHSATAAESEKYTDSLMANDYDLADARLLAEVETGQKWVQWLRGKADAARNAQVNWPGWSQATRDAAMVEFWGTFANELDGMADLLIVLNKGR